MIFVAIALSVALLGSLYVNYLWIKAFLEVGDIQGLSSLPTQSDIYEGMKEHDSSFRATEAEPESKKELVNVAIYNSMAYWVTDEGFVVAPLDEDEEVMYYLQEKVDVHSMSRKDVDMLMEILDALKEAKDEGFGSGE